MDKNFWLGVVVTTFLAIPAAMLASYLQALLSRYMDKQKPVKLGKRKQKAEYIFKQVAALHSGRVDKYLYFLQLLTSVSIGFLSAQIFFVGGMLVVVQNKYPNPAELFDLRVPDKLLNLVLAASLLFVALLFQFIAVIGSTKYRRYSSALRNFDSFKKDFETKWGALDRGAS
jgi:hypothetical protein